MWICYALSLLLAVITVRCISNYEQKSHLHESKSYSNIFSVTSNIIAVVLSVSVNTQPRSAPLRLFFLCWVRCNVAISSVPGVPHHTSYRTGIQVNNQNCGTNISIRHVLFLAKIGDTPHRYFRLHWLYCSQKRGTFPYLRYLFEMDNILPHHFNSSQRFK
jgi:hypothetical protein